MHQHRVVSQTQSRQRLHINKDYFNKDTAKISCTVSSLSFFISGGLPSMNLRRDFYKRQFDIKLQNYM